MKKIMVLFLALVVGAGCFKGDTGPMGPAGQDGQDAILAIRTWEGSLNTVSYTVPITWGAGEDVLVLAEVKLQFDDGSQGWTPISTLWTPDGETLYQTACAVYPGERKVRLWYAWGQYRVTLVVLS